jgi:hypothetical protein
MAALSVDGITAKDALTLAGFIQGTTKEEAEASAKSFVDTFGLPGATKGSLEEKPKGDEDDDEDDGVNPLQSRPTTGAPRNPLDSPSGGGPEKPVRDLLDLIPRR